MGGVRTPSKKVNPAIRITKHKRTKNGERLGTENILTSYTKCLKGWDYYPIKEYSKIINMTHRVIELIHYQKSIFRVLQFIFLQFIFSILSVKLNNFKAFITILQLLIGVNITGVFVC